MNAHREIGELLAGQDIDRYEATIAEQGRRLRLVENYAADLGCTCDGGLCIACELLMIAAGDL